MPATVSQLLAWVARAAIIIVVCATSARAQLLTGPRWGLVGAIGGGVGAGNLSCASCVDASGGGAAGFGRIGGAYRSDLIVAAQIDWWSTTTRAAFQSAELTLWSTNVVLQWFPSTTRRWFVTSGLGVGFVDIWTSAGNANLNARGLSYQLGGGYEVPLGLHVSLTPYASYFATPGGKISDSQERLSGAVGQLGVGLGWR